MAEQEPIVMRIGGNTNIASLASAIADYLVAGRLVHLRCIGVAAVDAAGKGAAVARSFLMKDQLGLLERPGLVDEQVDGRACTLTIIRLETYKK